MKRKNNKSQNEALEKNYQAGEENQNTVSEGLTVVHEQVSDVYNDGTIDQEKDRERDD
jgi:hypothetical protein